MDELSKIETTRKAMENTLAGLTLWERTLRGNGSALDANKPTRHANKTKMDNLEGGPLPHERVHRALSSMQGTFLRSKLYNESVADGLGPIARGTFGNIFVKLLKRKQIAVAKGRAGRKNCLYAKTQEEKVASIKE